MGHGNKCTPLSFDHKPECQTEIDRIYKAGSVIENGRVDGNLNLTRALGDLKYK
jgi:serine/threonine protein phosphatase PrpC